LVGVEEGLNLPPPVEIDPGNLSDSQRKAAGIRPMPANLGEALEAFDKDRGEQ
jgi:glutamine synthetase